MKRVLIIGIIIVIAISVVVVIYFTNINSGENENLLNNTSNTDCISAGQIVENPSARIDNGECCPGLKKIIEIPQFDLERENYDCDILSSLTGANYICSDCGNNICEDWENICNCSEDCQ